MSTVCSVSSISNRLLKWEMGEIKVQRMGTISFLLTIEDENFFMLEDLDWSYLKEIFSDIKPWSETVSYSERETWLEVTGMPLYCWNDVSLKKIKDLWGTFEALGVNPNHTRDCEKATILISTNQVKKIEEVIEIEIGDKIFDVSIVEIGFSNVSDSSVGKKWIDDNVKEVEMQKSESLFDLKSKQEKKEEVEDDQSCSGTEVIDVGLVENVVDINIEGSQRVVSDKIIEKIDTGAGEIEIGPIGVSSQLSEPVAKNMDKNECNVSNKDKAQDLKKSWANMLNERLNSGKGFVISDRGEALSEGENKEFSSSFPNGKSLLSLSGGENKGFSSSFHNGKSLFLLLKVGNRGNPWLSTTLKLLPNDGHGSSKSVATTLELPPVEGPGTPRSAAAATLELNSNCQVLPLVVAQLLLLLTLGFQDPQLVAAQVLLLLTWGCQGLH
ncbi:hypothetical protein V6N13_073840 [Hibiscus sabdariffa]